MVKIIKNNNDIKVVGGFLENSLQQAIWEHKGEIEFATQETLMGHPEYIAQIRG